jgi:hypothetical protein
MFLEIVPGLFGIFGLGWLYAGNTSAGLWWLFGMLGYLVLQVILFFTTVTMSSCIMYPIQLVILFVSVYKLSQYYAESFPGERPASAGFPAQPSPVEPRKPAGAICGECSRPLRQGAQFCNACGAPTAKTCPGCGQLNASNAQFCESCGLPVT